MELKQIRCTTCGESLSIETSLKEITCQACGNTFLMTQGIHLNNKTDDEIDTLKNLRIQLKRSVERQDIQSIEYHALEILKIIPDDYVSQYFFSYASYNLNKPKAFYEFLELDIASTQEDKRYVIEHMKAYADIKEYEKLHQYVDRVYPEMSEVLTQTLNQRIQQEDHYSVIDRDVFICHRSTDNKKALKVLNALEADGHTCWISSRNLRPDDSINYWSNIEEAIENCRVFLVISSQSAMLSKDVQKELQLANKMNKAKIEYKIDESVHTTLFKRSFDGVKWIEAIKGDNIETLQERVLDALEEVETKQQPKKTKVSLEETKSDDQSAKLKSLLIKLETQIRLEDYEEAEGTIEKIHEIDYQNEYAWWSKILCKHEYLNIDNMLLDIEKEVLPARNFFLDDTFKKVFILFNNSENMKPIQILANKLKFKAVEDKDLRMFEIICEYFKDSTDGYYQTLLNANLKSISELKAKILKFKKSIDYTNQVQDLRNNLESLSENNKLSAEDNELFEEIIKIIEEQKQIEIELEKQKQKVLIENPSKDNKKSKIYSTVLLVFAIIMGFILLISSYTNTLKLSNYTFSEGTITQYHGDELEVVIPDYINGEKVLVIGDGAFYDKNLRSVTIPESVTRIGSCAFCKNNLRSVTIPDSVTTIGDYAFWDSNLRSVTIPDSVTTIGDGAFRSNYLTTVTIPESVTTIGGLAFWDNNLTSVTILGEKTRFSYSWERIGFPIELRPSN